ncbi:MAG: biopolymer transporter ExbD [Sulfuricaulis sp.]|uniref:ExbD/TolR family protein n=1 Tax=Sulfuricaulis sp. TaxID=2003553 RepID=UPI0025FF7BD3|nr:biopolymer transporter ExbD [Sulfuricaulis sp.]MCR4345899.1 biopolymer transporter ExbD [Sulfuricaulis sp.]
MNFRPTMPEEEPELNLIPLIDVLLMTLIFLVVTTSFSNEARLSVRLPEASAEVKENVPSLRVTIDAKGQFYIGEQQLLNATPEVLRNALMRAAGGNKDPLIVVHADAHTPHEAVIRVMDSSRRLGFTRLTFATQQPSGQAARE